jgi:hypothetical protein
LLLSTGVGPAKSGFLDGQGTRPLALQSTPTGKRIERFYFAMTSIATGMVLGG